MVDTIPDRKAKLQLLHTEATAHLLKAKADAAERIEFLDTDYECMRSFFAGLVSGILIERCQDESIQDVIRRSRKYYAQLPKFLKGRQSGPDFEGLSELLRQLLDQTRPLEDFVMANLADYYTEEQKSQLSDDEGKTMVKNRLDDQPCEGKTDDTMILNFHEDAKILEEPN